MRALLHCVVSLKMLLSLTETTRSDRMALHKVFCVCLSACECARGLDICIFNEALSVSLWFALMFATRVLIIGMVFVMNYFKANIYIQHVFVSCQVLLMIASCVILYTFATFKEALHEMLKCIVKCLSLSCHG